jgi:ATP-binding cassette subfamily F protein 3
MANEEVVIRFEDVSFKYKKEDGNDKVTLDEANFSIRNNAKITIMGQNGAGKTTIFRLLMGEIQPTGGKIHIKLGSKIGIAKQMIPHDMLDYTIVEYFQTAFTEKKYGIERNIKDVLEVVNLDVALDKKISDLSGGQKARILLAYALIQDPDILLLDEPTNNLDQVGIEHLTTFLIMYPKTCIVISHDADFLNCFTDGVLNLDVHSHKVEQFVGNYYDVQEQIAAQIERTRLLNSRINKSIVDRFEKVNKLGGKSVAMRRLARKVRDDIEEDREKIEDVRQEDRTIPDFVIPAQNCPSTVIKINEVSMVLNHKVVTKKVDIDLWKGRRLIIKGPNGIGKSTLIRSLIDGKGSKISDGVKVGYYSQDFSELDFDKTAFDTLLEVMPDKKVQNLYGAAGRFLLPGELLKSKVGDLSEGQKGLLCYARFMLMEPGLLIMDEPTNHINFRHIPVIAKALNNYEGTLIIVSHVPSFISEIKIHDELNLEKLAKD